MKCNRNYIIAGIAVILFGIIVALIDFRVFD
jgi:hypothetical protein